MKTNQRQQNLFSLNKVEFCGIAQTKKNNYALLSIHKEQKPGIDLDDQLFLRFVVCIYLISYHTELLEDTKP